MRNNGNNPKITGNNLMNKWELNENNWKGKENKWK
jgi:hypothetical protein